MLLNWITCKITVNFQHSPTSDWTQFPSTVSFFWILHMSLLPPSLVHVALIKNATLSIRSLFTGPGAAQAAIRTIVWKRASNELLDSDNEVLVWKSDLSIWSPLFNNQFIYTSHNYKHILSQKYDYISYNSHSQSLFTASEPQHSPHLLGFRSSLVPKPSAVQKRWSKLHRPGTCCCVLDGRPWIPNKTLKLKYWSEILPDIVLSS